MGWNHQLDHFHVYNFWFGKIIFQKFQPFSGSFQASRTLIFRGVYIFFKHFYRTSQEVFCSHPRCGNVYNRIPEPENTFERPFGNPKTHEKKLKGFTP